MGEKEYSILQKKFREWFGETGPVAKPLPDETDYSIGNSVTADLLLTDKKDLQKKFREWFGETVPVAKPLPDDKVDYPNGNSAEANLLLTDKTDHLNRGGKIVKRSSTKNKIIIDTPKGKSFVGLIRNIGGVVLFIIFIGLVIGFCAVFVPILDILQSILNGFLAF